MSRLLNEYGCENTELAQEVHARTAEFLRGMVAWAHEQNLDAVDLRLLEVQIMGVVGLAFAHDRLLHASQAWKEKRAQRAREQAGNADPPKTGESEGDTRALL